MDRVGGRPRLMRPYRCALALALVPQLAAIAGAEPPPPQAMRLEHLSADDVLAIVRQLMDAGRFDDAQALLDQLAANRAGGTEREFLEGMIALARKDYRRAEAVFRRILDDDPVLLRVRLELARTLFLAKKDEAADYQFRLALAKHPPAAVLHNVTVYREAIRARRAWRFNLELGLAPDTNINSATAKERIEIFGLPFRLSPDARARSGVGITAGGDASVRLRRFSRVPLYLGAYGRMVRYGDHRFDDIYIGGEAGPEFRLCVGRLRLASTGLVRWYGGKQLMTSAGGRLVFDEVIGGKLSLEAGLAVRHNAYVRRDDVDGWDIEGSVSANRALSPSTVGFTYAAVQRTIAHDPANSYWQARLGAGVLREIGWGLRPQVTVEVGRQVNDAPMALFGQARRDWQLHAAASIYKRDWNVAGFAPSLRVTWTRYYSTIALYDQKRVRAEFGIAKAF